jgi:hypothetical protein
MGYYKIEELSSPPIGFFAPTAVNGGRVVGWTWSGFSFEPILWDGFGAALDLGTAGGPWADGMAMGVNSAGDIVGTCASVSFGSYGYPVWSEWQAFVRKADGSIDRLGSVLGDQSALGAINDAGLAIARGNISDVTSSNVFAFDTTKGAILAARGTSRDFHATDLAHPACADEGQDLVRPECRAGLERHLFRVIIGADVRTEMQRISGPRGKPRRVFSLTSHASRREGPCRFVYR